MRSLRPLIPALLVSTLIAGCGGSQRAAPVAGDDAGSGANSDGGTDAAPAAPSILGEHQLLAVIERGRTVVVAAEEFHFALALKADGTYHFVEWERGAKQKEAQGKFSQEEDRLILHDLGPDMDFTLLTHVTAGAMWFCFSASVEEGEGIGTIEGEHRMIEVTRNGMVKTDAPERMSFDLGAGEAFAVRADGSEETLHGTYRLDGPRLIFIPEGQPEAEDGAAQNALGIWLVGKRLVLCRDLFRATVPSSQ